MKPMVLVTGANGHIGSNLIKELILSGYRITAFIRENAFLKGIEGLDIKYRFGNVLNEESFVRAAEGCEVIFHTAAVYRIWAKDPKEIMAPAIEGAKNLLSAARRNNVARRVYTSSVAAVGASPSTDVFRTEEDWNEDPTNVYVIAKTESEKLIHKLSEQHRISCVSVCPSIVLGPLNFKITPSMEILKNWINGKGTLWTGIQNFVSVSDVAKTHVLACEKGESGKRYLAVGENIYIPEIGNILKEMVGIKPLYLPGFVLNYMGALFFETISWLTGNPPFTTRSWVKEGVYRYLNFDSSKTRADLGIEPKGIRETFTEAISWLLFRNQIKKKIAQRIFVKFPIDPEWVNYE